MTETEMLVYDGKTYELVEHGPFFCWVCPDDGCSLALEFGAVCEHAWKYVYGTREYAIHCANNHGLLIEESADWDDH